MDQSTITSLLAGLGNAPDEVAATLKIHGIQGVQNAVRILNPLVRFLACQLPERPFHLDVIQRDHVRVIYGDGRNEEIPIPKPVLLFLDSFNNGDYPEIVAKVFGSP